MILGYLKFIKKTWGLSGLEQCAKDLSLDYKAIKDGGWYSEKISGKVLAWIAKNKGPEYVENAGSHVIKNLGILSYVVRFAKITTLLRKSPKGYSEAFGYGRVEVDLHENKRQAIIRMIDTALDEYSCAAWLGAYRGMLEMTKTRGRVREIRCQRAGADFCEFLMEWE